MEWTEVSNGDLLLAAEAQFDALVITDQNLRYQQSSQTGNSRFLFYLLQVGRSSVSVRGTPLGWRVALGFIPADRLRRQSQMEAFNQEQSQGVSGATPRLQRVAG